MLYQVHHALAVFELTRLVVIVTDCIGIVTNATTTRSRPRHRVILCHCMYHNLFYSEDTFRQRSTVQVLDIDHPVLPVSITILQLTIVSHDLSPDF